MKSMIACMQHTISIFNTRAMYGEYGTNTESEFAKRTGLPLTAVKKGRRFFNR